MLILEKTLCRTDDLDKPSIFLPNSVVLTESLVPWSSSSPPGNIILYDIDELPVKDLFLGLIISLIRSSPPLFKTVKSTALHVLRHSGHVDAGSATLTVLQL